VKNPSPPTSSEHPEALLLPYVEDIIGPSEKAGVEEHLSGCRECTSRVQELRQTIADLKQNKEAFCPELWELHEFAQSGKDPHGDISAHAENCPLCSEDLSAWKTAAVEETPPELWSRLKEQLPGEAREQIPSERPSWSQMVLEKLAQFWKAPTIAAGAVAAVLLVVVIFYSQAPEPMVPRPKSLPQKTAFVVLFENFKAPALQTQIESVYEALSASPELKDRYSLVSPAETSKVIESGKAPSDNRSAMIEGLRKHLNVSRVLAVTVFPSGDKFAVRVELIDTVRGKTLQTKTDERIERNELAARVRSDVRSMLLQPNDQP
jgi:anti-sigma-K factor RskA